MMPAPVASTAPTITPQIMQQLEQVFGTSSYGTGANQGLGASYTSMIPAYLQMAAQGSLPANLQNDPVANWLIQNGYLQGDLASGNITGGYKSEGVSTSASGKAVYNPQDPNNVGSGYGSDQGNQNLLLAPNNPFGYSTIGSQDVHELASPTQAPQMFGTGAFGDTTVNKADLAQNQDFMSKYGIPIMEMIAGAGFGGGLAELGAFGDFSAFQSLFNVAGNAVTSQNGSNINPVSILPAVLKMFGQGS